jgi:hypothetical protein
LADDHELRSVSLASPELKDAEAPQPEDCEI